MHFRSPVWERLTRTRRAKVRSDQFTVNGATHHFTANVYTVGDKHTQVDPRLGPLLVPWRMLFQSDQTTQEEEFNNEGKRGLLIFQNMENKKIQRADPRLTSARLRGMEINVQDFVVM